MVIRAFKSACIPSLVPRPPGFILAATLRSTRSFLPHKGEWPLAQFCPSPKLASVSTHCHVTPPSQLVLMYQLAGLDDGLAQDTGLPEMFGLTAEETTL